MHILYLIIFFILGIILGSFYVEIGIKLAKKEKLFSLNNYCSKCSHTLKIYEMIPIFSYIFLRGRCRYCHSKIDDMPIYMELFTGILFSLSYFAFGLSSNTLIALGIVTMLIIVSVSDMTYYIIPDEVLIFFAGFFLIVTCLSKGVLSALFALLSGIVLFFVMYGVMWFGSIIFKKECLGGGDVKMMFVFGIVLHPVLGLISIFLGSLLALPVSLIFLWKQNNKMIPFGPFLLISFAFIFFTRIDMNMVLEYLKLL